MVCMKLTWTVALFCAFKNEEKKILVESAKTADLKDLFNL